MEECAKCSRREDEVRLFDGIYVNESVKICERCALLEGIPIVKLPNTGQLKESEKGEEVYKRLTRITGMRKEKPEKSIYEELRRLKEKPELTKPEEKPVKYIPNYNWIIKRHRRLKKLTHTQLAEMISESETALRLIERKELPENALEVIKKLEQFFQIKLIEYNPNEKPGERIRKPVFYQPKTEVEIVPKTTPEEEVKVGEIEIIESKEELTKPEPIKIKTIEEPREEPSRVLEFKKDKMRDITISDLKEMQRVVEKDFPKKTSEEIGREQLEDFGKKDAPSLKKFWFEGYKKAKQPQQEASVPAKPAEPVPTIAELAEKKGKDGKVLGSDIELVEEKPDETGQ